MPRYIARGPVSGECGSCRAHRRLNPPPRAGAGPPALRGGTAVVVTSFPSRRAAELSGEECGGSHTGAEVIDAASASSTACRVTQPGRYHRARELAVSAPPSAGDGDGGDGRR